MIYIFVSVEWQCFIYAKIINSSKNKNLDISVIVLRSELKKNIAWKSIEHLKPKFIDLSNQFKSSELGLKYSLKNSKQICRTFKSSINNLSSKEHILLTDNIYRVHEMTLLSLLPKTCKVIRLPHGLTEATSRAKIKNIISNTLRVVVLFYIPRVFMKLPFFFIKDRLISVTYNGNPKKRNHFISGNLQIKLSVDRLSKIKVNYQKTNNVLFFGSGAFRYSNDIFDSRLTEDAIHFVNDYCTKNDKKFFFKFKKEESTEVLKSFKNFKDFIILDDSTNLIDIIKKIQPEYIFCSSNSTLVSELMLSGYNVVIYDSGNFKGVARTMNKMYHESNIEIQDLNSIQLNPAVFRTENDKKKLEESIGFSNINFNLIDKCI